MTELLVLASLAAVVASACIAIEFAARAWIRYRADYFVMPPGLRLEMKPDSETFPQLERAIRFNVNSRGERGGEVPSSREVYRILVAGGSTPEGFLLDQATTWPGALERLLDTPERCRALGASHVHVGSIARSGVGSEALDLILNRVLPRYPRLQLVIIMVGATDVLRWLEYGAPASTPAVVTADVFRCHPEMTFGWSPGTLATGELIRRARRQLVRPIQHNDRAGRWIGRARAMRARAKELKTAVPDPQPMLASFRQHFTRILEQAQTHADRVIVVRQPWFEKQFSREELGHMWHGGVGQIWREDVTTFYSVEVCAELMRLVDSHVAVLTAAQRVEQIDLMPWLDQSLNTFYDAFHLTPAGARAVAATVAAAILADHAPPLLVNAATGQSRQPRRTRAAAPSASSTGV